MTTEDGKTPCSVTSGFRNFVENALPTGSANAHRVERIARAIRRLHALDDFAGLAAAYWTCWVLRFGFDVDPFKIVFKKVFVDAALPIADVSRYAVIYAAWSPVYLAIGFAFLFVAYSLAGMYDGSHRMIRTPVLWNYVVCNFVLLVSVSALAYFTRETWHMRGFIPGVILLNIPISYVFRRITNALIKRERRLKGGYLFPGLLVGSGALAESFAEMAARRQLKGYGVVDRAEIPDPPELAVRTIDPALMSKCAPLIVIAPGRDDVFFSEMLKAALRTNSGMVFHSERFLTLHNPFTYGDTLRGVPLVHFPMLAYHADDGWLHSFVNRFLALLGIIVLSPVFLAVAAAIKADSPGPVFFVQKRYGKGNRGFNMYKFRTMCVDAEAKLAALRSRNETDGALFKMRDDPRITRVGKFLRATSLDELPQFFNILFGDMNIVGPRPLPCADVEPYLDSWQGLRHAVKPGLTCIWQVAGRSDIGFDSMSFLDLWYACNRTWVLDLRIMLRTVWTVLFGHGAY